MAVASLSTPETHTGEPTTDKKLPGLPARCLRALGGDRRHQARALPGSAAIWADNAAATSTKTSPSLCCLERGPLPHQERRTHSIILKYSLACTLRRVCSGDGGLRRPICLADHCLFDAAANVTFLFQSKTQQGVPSVWHRPPRTSPMPFCADHFTWQFAKIFHSLLLLNITIQNGLFSRKTSNTHKWRRLS